MNQFSLEQLAAALSALGISIPNMDVAVGPASHVHASADMAAGPLLTFHCSHCSFPNAVSFSAAPTMMGILLPSSRSGDRPVPRASDLAHATIAPATVTPATATPAPVIHAPVAPAPIVHAPIAIAPTPAPAPIVAPAAPAPGPSQPVSVAVTVGPDGPWYVVTKGHSVGIYRGWQNVSSLVTGVGRACFFHCSTRAAAQASFDEALATSAVEIL